MASIQEHFKTLMEKHQCQELPIERDPLLVTESMHPAEAFKFLAENGIRACPVRSDDGAEIVGTLDLRDSCGYIVETFLTTNPKGTTALSKMPSFGKSRGYIKATATNIKEICRVRPFYVFSPDVSLLEIARTLATGSHIIGIGGGPEEKGGLSRVVTQGMLLKFVAPELSNTPTPVKAAMTSSCISIRVTDPTVKGFDLMASKNVSSLAAVDENGVIIHNMSTSDVKIFFGTPDFEGVTDLNMPLEDFLAKKRSASAKQKTMAPISVCKEDDDLSNVVTKLVKTGYHRVWVVKDKKPIGVLSLTDVFKKLAPSEGDKKDDCCIL
mmetsp:Transcript_39331/g.80574  ORF Transcript_39331/g.80574 Transcript_39331/m.80574 type:complete len:325 (+) Transcript_39331:228-1202(+)|eukprot:CAMPEP_0181331956 /NCGR_PEP_ID=MMETSP1101-20121128/24811_1 /TAXON_ID=46948 /ORGANISM="Rhodomonas abbreviata, Strain Caron Lab Isolate" /LENGTH=324 /DNA_ID=CAMNT_0023441517 /DNA_START=227 /DNA_END=1201 /DNA_ORIENTATION=+